MFDFVLVFVILLLVWWYRHKTRIYVQGFPPGPRFPLPVVGDLLSVGSQLPSGLECLHKKYGKIVGLNLGGLPTVSVADFDLIQSALAKEEFTGRPPMPGLSTIRGGSMPNGTLPGIIFGYGPDWLKFRRFSLRTLRDFGFGKSSMEELILNEVKELNETLEELTEQPTDTRLKFHIPVLSALWTITSGETLSPNDPNLLYIMHIMDQAFIDMGRPVVQMAFQSSPLLTFLETVGKCDLTGLVNKMFEKIDSMIKEHTETFLPETPRDLTDCFLRDQNDMEEQLKQLSLRNVIIDLFFAGAETTSTTLTWTMLYMAKYPEIQKKVQQELDKIPGTIIQAHRPSTPYTEATILEVQRLSQILPLSLVHYTTQDTTLGGYYLPKGTQIMPHIGMVMMDDKHFPEPKKFRPERYLKDGQFVPHPRVIPFGVGKRRCLGETLAKAELYLFFTGIMQNFSVVSVVEPKQLDVTPVCGFTMSAKPFNVKFVPRK